MAAPSQLCQRKPASTHGQYRGQYCNTFGWTLRPNLKWMTSGYFEINLFSENTYAKFSFLPNRRNVT